MTVNKKVIECVVLGLLVILCLVGSEISSLKQSASTPRQTDPHSPEFQKAFFDASRVYGKTGCGDQILAEKTAKKSLETGVPAQLIAAMISAESTCNPLAVSNRGAIGLMQVVPKSHSKEYDFSRINLFNSDDNMTVGVDIIRKLINNSTIKSGLIHYYGTGSDSIGLGGTGYADHVLQIMGKL